MSTRWTIFRLIALTALALSSASLVDSLFFSGAFCGFRSGCGEVTASAYGRPLGIPLPIVGVAGFSTILLLSLIPNRYVRNAVRIIAAAAGLAGLALILVQALILERYCTICLLIDAASVALLAAAMAAPSGADRPRLYWLRCSGWVAVGVVAAALPLLWAMLTANRPPPAPVTAHWLAGRINVVEVTDFDCRYCAQAEPIVANELRGRADIHFVRLPAPMPKHANARPAARAFLAAQRLGKGEQMASALFAAESRSTDDCRRLARGLGLDLDDFDRLVNDPALEAELDSALAWAPRAGPGLPLLWVQDHFFPKMPTSNELRQVLDRTAPFQPPR